MDFQKKLETKRATVLYLRSAGKTLMLHRNKDRNDFLYEKWVPPGGKIMPNESEEACARREFSEETGYEVVGHLMYRGKVLFDNYQRTFHGKPAKYSWLVHIFEAHAYQGKLRHPKEGTLAWIPNTELSSLSMEEGDYLIINWLTAGRTICERITYKGEKFERHELLQET